MKKLSPLLLAALALLAGCSSGDDPTAPSPSTSATSSSVASTTSEPATTSASPTPTTLSVEEAGPAYLAAVQPYNDCLPEYNAAVNSGGSDIKPVIAAAEACRVGADQFLRALVSTAWPDVIATEIAALTAEMGNEVSFFGQVAIAKTLDEVNAELAAQPTASGQGAIIRAKLGLPAVQP